MRILHIVRKELLEMRRERKYLAKAVAWLVPIGLIMGMVSVIAYSDIDLGRPLEPMTVAASGEQNAPRELVAELAKFGVQLTPHSGDLEAAVRARSVPVGIAFARSEPDGRLSARIFGNASRAAKAQVLASTRALASYNRSQLAPDFVAQLPRLESEELITSNQRRGGELVPVLVMAVVILMHIVGAALFVDSLYGENERMTFESLRLAAGRDSVVILGKLSRVFLVVAFLLLVPVATFVVGRLLMGGSWGAVESIAALQFVLLALELCAVTLSLFVFSALLAPTSKRASFFCNLVAIVVTGIATLTSMGFLGAGEWTRAVPVVSSGALMRTLLLNGTLPALSLVISSAGMLAACVVGLQVVIRNFKKERLLYPEK